MYGNPDAREVGRHRMAVASGCLLWYAYWAVSCIFSPGLGRLPSSVAIWTGAVAHAASIVLLILAFRVRWTLGTICLAALTIPVFVAWLVLAGMLWAMGFATPT